LTTRDKRAGQKLAELRNRKGLSMRDVDELSQQVANQRGNRAFLIPPSRLSEIESRGVIPNIHRLYTLFVVYGCTLKKLLAFYGLD